MIRRFAKHQARLNERRARWWRTHPYRMTALFVTVAAIRYKKARDEIERARRRTAKPRTTRVEPGRPARVLR